MTNSNDAVPAPPTPARDGTVAPPGPPAAAPAGPSRFSPPQSAALRLLVRSREYRHPRRWVGVRVACGVFNIVLGVALLAFARELGALTWLAALPLAGAALIFWTVYLLQQASVQRVSQLEQSRARVMDDSAARLRRIERDLHDGAQAQLVAVAMKLSLAREKLGAAIDGTAPADLDRVLELVDAAHRGAREAITELRDLARGIHPPVLDHGLGTALTTLAARSEVPVELVTDLPARPSAAIEAIAELRDLARGIHPSVLDHGLGTALTTLAARSDVPVELVLDLPDRPAAAIETIAYFCAAELLSNVAKHSGARHATLAAVLVPGLLQVRVSDDGSGGARMEARGGLAGLAERMRTVDGRLRISSPSGGPTVITVELPSHP